jgi:tetratricopeptide (TPR) repeat protein
MKCVAIFVLAACALAQSKSPGYAAYQHAADLFDHARYDEALTELDRALHLDARLVPALTLKAKLAMSIKRYDLAGECLEKALAAEPGAAYAQFLLGFLHYQQNQMPEAVKALEKARRLDPRDPRAALYLGLSEETLGATARAMDLYQEAIRLEKSSGKPHAEAWIACAKLMMVEGNLPGAAELLKSAVEIEPGSRDTHFVSARLLLKQGRPLEAARAGERALKLPGETADSQVEFLLVQAYRAAGRDQEAETHANAIRALERR